MLSETDTCRDILAPWCQGKGIDMGYGGSLIVPHAWAFDLPRPYTNVGGERQQLRGEAMSLPFLCDGALDFVYSSHLLEDYTYQDLSLVLREWRRVLREDGLIITNCPDQQRFLAHCERTGQGLNLAHKEPDFSLDNYKRVLLAVGTWHEELVVPVHGPYSWLHVARKI